ncbi:hypothetical protein MPTK1_2g05090 [Marchantia polymorpha subsp. ruderalis]|uniref:Uncharacterized protein n=1 Tax=Marchantia polymorpha TaxID=3197 RepID=A0A2R6X7X1_MARPO|nr:hypothetical protein MARPO_0031s0163 [Marchantia polymorpha]BBN01150.1 hypothetical protein Mp_2g05090 [Marchantia polymorpha subsp. ruderalis]|eukprot:PTQ42200.1 hypothetical protein MARPO_0031s0163 [Marchantia polymorpha]
MSKTIRARPVNARSFFEKNLQSGNIKFMPLSTNENFTSRSSCPIACYEVS